jgi:diguanylate cyclase (GGDEF)-like protein
MSLQITTDADVMRQTMQRIAVSTGISLAMTATITLMSLGGNPDALVRVGDVIIISLCAATMISAVISGILSYRSARLMKELTLTRRELSRLSQTDKLTGLLNRRGFDEAATLALRTACQASASAVVFMCDIDHFKSVNDRHGHATGDRVLSSVADAIRSMLLDRGQAFRYGGEEIAVGLPGELEEGTRDWAERLRAAVGSLRLETREGAPFAVTASFGAVECGPPWSDDWRPVVERADLALYAAKRQGRNRVVVWRESLDTES